MFTGIIEGLGELKESKKKGDNIHFTFSCPFTNELKIDQSLAHNGICLTVVEINGGNYTVTAIDETLQKTNIGKIKIAPTFPCIKSRNGLVATNLAETYIDNGSGGKRIKFECGDFSLGPF